MKKLLKYVIFILLFCELKSQVPDTDLWLFKIETNKEKTTSLKSLGNITKRSGYDNQPSFSIDNKKIYYASIREDKQSDIFYFDMKSKKNIRLSTSITESEYSPELTKDGKFISVVTVESDSAQRIHFMNSYSGNYDRKYDFDSVGYCTFLNEDTIVYYKLTKPHSLRYFVASTNEDKFLANSPIRTFKAINRHTIIFGTKDSTKVAFFKYNFHLDKLQKYCEFPSLNEDIVWHKTLGLIKSENNKLFNYNEQKKDWVLLYDLSQFGIKKITRFVFDSENEYLVIVDNL